MINQSKDVVSTISSARGSFVNFSLIEKQKKIYIRRLFVNVKELEIKSKSIN